jgi:transcription elongation factor GreB
MSKAFTKEHDTEDDLDEDDLPAPVTPTGKNYMTPAGAKKLQDELRELRYKIRPEVTQTVAWAAGNGDRSENGDYLYGKKRLREIDRRIRFLSKRLDIVEIVDPLKVNSDQVLFGATVTIRDEEDREKTYSIVGIDETDLSQGRISWISPLASALFKAREGDIVTFRSPKGPQEIEIVGIRYVELP